MCVIGVNQCTWGLIRVCITIYDTSICSVQLRTVGCTSGVHRVCWVYWMCWVLEYIGVYMVRLVARRVHTVCYILGEMK